jgi:WbqC-like protein family
MGPLGKQARNMRTCVFRREDILTSPYFKAAGIITEWMDYHRYREYPRQYCGFGRTVTVLDLIFQRRTRALADGVG